MASIGDVRQLVAGLADLEVPVPEAISIPLAALDALRAAGTTPAIAPLEVADWHPRDVVTRVQSAALDQMVREQLVATANGSEAAVISLIGKALRGDAGTEIVLALRPAFDAAVTGVAQANYHFGPGTDGARVMDLGDDAVTAWRELPAHAAVLERIHGGVLGPLALDFGVLGYQADLLRPVDVLAGWYVQTDVEHAGSVGFGGLHTGLGGRWHALLNRGHALTLNTPAEARTILDQHREAADDYDTALAAIGPVSTYVEL